MDGDILEVLYQRYYHAALLYCTALCGDTYLAQDIVSDAFIKAYLSLPNDVPSFRYWLLRVCKNIWIDSLRRHSRELPEDSLPQIMDPVTPEITYLKNERNQCLWHALSELPDLDRELVILHYFSGLSLQEITGIMGKNYAAVRQRMVRLRHILKHKMEEQGYGF